MRLGKSGIAWSIRPPNTRPIPFILKRISIVYALPASGYLGLTGRAPVHPEPMGTNLADCTLSEPAPPDSRVSLVVVQREQPAGVQKSSAPPDDDVRVLGST